MIAMELFLFSGTLASILANDLVWKTPPSVKQLEDEKYWETQIKLWEMQRKREKLNNQIQNSL